MQVVFRQTTGFKKVQISEDRRRLELGKLRQSMTWGRRSGGEIRKEAPSLPVNSCTEKTQAKVSEVRPVGRS